MAAQKILIVDDIPGFREIVADMVNEIGFSECLQAGDGTEALEIARREQPILIISDYMMAPRDGLMLLEDLKRDSNLKHIPFIMVSAVSEKDVMENALQLGASGFMVRPLSFNSLKNQVITALASAMQ